MMRLAEHYDDILCDDEIFIESVMGINFDLEKDNVQRPRKEIKMKINLSVIYTSFCLYNHKLGSVRDKFAWTQTLEPIRQNIGEIWKEKRIIQ